MNHFIVPGGVTYFTDVHSGYVSELEEIARFINENGPVAIEYINDEGTASLGPRTEPPNPSASELIASFDAWSRRNSRLARSTIGGGAVNPAPAISATSVNPPSANTVRSFKLMPAIKAMPWYVWAVGAVLVGFGLELIGYSLKGVRYNAKHHAHNGQAAGQLKRDDRVPSLFQLG